MTNSNGDPVGLDLRIYVGGVSLNGANKLIVTYTGAYVTTATAYQVQIWDTTGGGQWRNMVNQELNLSNIAQTTYVYEIYNGYWQSGGSPVDTPLGNFIDSGNNNRVAVRIYSAVSSTTQFNLDRVLVETAIDPVYSPASFNKVQGGTVTGDYTDAQVSDNYRQDVYATASVPSEFYYSFKNVDYYPDANTIVVVSEDAPSNVSFGYDIYIWNWNTGGIGDWEKLNSTTITGSTTETNRPFAKNNVTLDDDYIKNGEVRVEYKSTSSVVYYIRVDRLYIIVGSTNSQTDQSETSWGTEANGTTVDGTRDLDYTAATPNTWQHTSVLEYPTNGDYYPSDNDGDATSGEAAYASNLNVPITVPDNAVVTAIHRAARFKNDTTAITCQLGIKDYSGINNASVTAGSGWAFVGTVATNAYVYSDSKTAATAAQACLLTNPEDYIDTDNDVANLRLRTSGSTDTSGGTTRDWDFAFVSIRYINEPNRKTISSQYKPDDGELITGSNTLTPSNTLVKTWRGAVVAELTYWSVTNSDGDPAGLDMRLYINNVSLNGANKLIISYSGYYTTATNYQVQIYDTTVGQWRNMINKGGNFNSALVRHYVFEVYNGFWQSGGSPVDTPLSNFIDSYNNDRVAIRIYSEASSTAQFNLDRILVETAIDPYYQPASFTKVQGTTVNGDYTRAQVSDESKNEVLGTGSVPSEFYYSFKNVDYYPDANTIVVVSEDSPSNASFGYDIYIWNFNTLPSGAWEKLNFTTITGSTTDTLRYLAKNNVSDMSDYISGLEVRIAYKSTSSLAYSIRVDRSYIIVGSTNSQSGQSETSWGTEANGTTVDNTRTLDSTAAPTSTWQHTSVAEYPAAGDYYPSDNDGSTPDGEHAYASNLNVPITVPDNAVVTAIHQAARFKNDTTAITCQLGIKDYSGINNASVTAGSGWAFVGTVATNAWVYTDSKANTSTAINSTTVQPCLLVNPAHRVDTSGNVANLRLRTSASTDTTTAYTRDWDFGFVSIRYIGAPAFSGSLRLSDQDVSWANVNPDNPPNNTGKGLVCTVSSNGSWSVTVTASSGDAQGKLWSAANSMAYGGTFTYTSTGAAGPTYQGSSTSFTTTGTNVANYSAPETAWPITVSYTLGTITWATLSGSYTSTHTYTLLAL